MVHTIERFAGIKNVAKTVVLCLLQKSINSRNRYIHMSVECCDLKTQTDYQWCKDNLHTYLKLGVTELLIKKTLARVTCLQLFGSERPPHMFFTKGTQVVLRPRVAVALYIELWDVTQVQRGGAVCIADYPLITLLILMVLFQICSSLSL